MQTRIQFTARGSCSLLGNFAPGDLATCDAAYARHLVEEARCAKFLDASASDSSPGQAEGPAADVKRPRKRT